MVHIILQKQTKINISVVFCTLPDLYKVRVLIYIVVTGNFPDFLQIHQKRWFRKKSKISRKVAKARGFFNNNRLPLRALRLCVRERLFAKASKIKRAKF